MKSSKHWALWVLSLPKTDPRFWHSLTFLYQCNPAWNTKVQILIRFCEKILLLQQEFNSRLGLAKPTMRSTSPPYFFILVSRACYYYPLLIQMLSNLFDLRPNTALWIGLESSCDLYASHSAHFFDWIGYSLSFLRQEPQSLQSFSPCKSSILIDKR